MWLKLTLRKPVAFPVYYISILKSYFKINAQYLQYVILKEPCREKKKAIIKRSVSLFEMFQN